MTRAGGQRVEFRLVGHLPHCGRRLTLTRQMLPDLRGDGLLGWFRDAGLGCKDRQPTRPTTGLAAGLAHNRAFPEAQHLMQQRCSANPPSPRKGYPTTPLSPHEGG